MDYYAVMTSETEAKIFRDPDEACLWGHSFFKRTGVSPLLLTCSAGIEPTDKLPSLTRLTAVENMQINAP